VSPVNTGDQSPAAANAAAAPCQRGGDGLYPPALKAAVFYAAGPPFDGGLPQSSPIYFREEERLAKCPIQDIQCDAV
jgi:hypothetical protein